MSLIDSARLPPYTLGAFGRTPFRLGFGLSTKHSAALSQDGQSLWLTKLGNLVSLSLDTGLARALVRPSTCASYDHVLSSCDGVTFVLIGYQGALWFDPNTQTVLAKVDGSWPLPRACAASPKEAGRVAVCFGDKRHTLLLLSPKDGGSIVPVSLEASDSRIVRLAFSAEGEELFVARHDRVLRVDARTGALLGELCSSEMLGPTGRPLIWDLLVIDAERVLVVSSNGELFMLDARSGTTIARGDAETSFVGVVAGPTQRGRIVLVSSGLLIALDGRTLEPVRSCEGPFSVDRSTDVLVDSARELVWIVDPRGAVHRVELETGELCAAVPCHMVTALAFDGGIVRVARFESPVESIDMRTGESVFSASSAGQYNVTFSRDGAAAFIRAPREGRWLSLRSGSESARITRPGLDALAGERCWYFDKEALCSEGQRIPVENIKHATALAVSPSGTRALLATRSEGILVDLEAGAVLSRYKLGGASAVVMVSDAEAVVSSEAKGTRWIDVQTGAVLAHVKRFGGEHIAVSQDGTRVACCRGVESVGLVARDRPDAPVWFVGGAFPMPAAFSEDGTRLVVGGSENVVRIFDVEAALATRPEPKAKRGKR